ncbi:MAG: hypothetical protein WB767_11590 [Nocardioides sp.]
MFSKRLRLTLAAVFATATVVTTTVGVAAPAHATPGTTCVSPSVSGTVTKNYNIYTGRYVYSVSNSGWTTASCPSTYTDYRYDIEYRLADFQGGASYSTADLVASTSLTAVHNRMNGARIGTSIAFPNASYSEPQYFGYSGVYVFVSAYAKSRFASSWSSEPAEVQTYFLPGTGDFDTHGMSESKPSNYCYAYGYSKGGC